jgi:hypothetical protein
VIYSMVDSTTFFYLLASGAAVSFIYCLIFLKEPKGSFAEEMDDGGAAALPDVSAPESHTKQKRGDR